MHAMSIDDAHHRRVCQIKIQKRRRVKEEKPTGNFLCRREPRRGHISRRGNGSKGSNIGLTQSPLNGSRVVTWN